MRSVKIYLWKKKMLNKQNVGYVMFCFDSDIDFLFLYLSFGFFFYMFRERLKDCIVFKFKVVCMFIR